MTASSGLVEGDTVHTVTITFDSAEQVDQFLTRAVFDLVGKITGDPSPTVEAGLDIIDGDQVH